MLFLTSAAKFREACEKVRSHVTLRQRELVTVFDLHQIQTKWMRGHAASAAHTTLEHLPRPFDRPLSRADGHQHTGDVAHHVVQESVGTYVDDDHLAVARDAQVVQLLDRRFSL